MKNTHRRSPIIAALGTAILAASSLTACSLKENNGQDSPNLTRLTMADNYALKHPVGKGGTQPFLDAMTASAQETGMTIDYFASGQLGKQADIPSIVRSGNADLAVIAPGYVSSTFPLSGIGDLPGFGSDSCVTAYALRDLVMPGGILYDKEMAPMKFRPLWTGSIPGYEAMSAGIDPSNPDNLRGKVLRSTGGALDRVIDQMHAAGVAMPIGDLYEALSRGTVEGTLASPISITPYGLEDVITDATDGAEQGNFTFFYGINVDTWDSLTMQQQEALTHASEQAQQSLCETLNGSRAKSIAAMKKAGVRFHDVAQNRAQWEALNEPVKQSWINAAESTGLAGHEVMDAWESALKKHAHRATKRG
ncbi:ABC transporter substrate-binding protein [Corynebacterium sp. 320]|uniref:TRAP transporter substrate-binding protein n=1 Tax=Corynebacterium TaxID=1716 RepID=UPI00125CB49B|nr:MULTISPECIES: TRAP transporter substrate-binding protein DctP [Corynebacterium]KAB1503126.1 ABC transporter substrate-binding protein [Corynebacterium sp. 320]KAB1550660.1 ABC transporter substrate-binding protein [Corynebacterium sp. 321]KAB1551022.1 ABC transporter substrate-binding protein [Corynebacterium sp. 319]KAB3526923.1 ABC transporter substrate-binding protein [Corynebacterium sp. 250]KAB3538416.1 ABC transporter substrate-binding protein [Corynebacterium sp. 366]